MKVLDLFSGIGGFSLGLERAGMETVAFCEIDPECQRVLRKHWPELPIYSNIKSLRGAEIEADVICGGYPCQPYSVAGRRRGSEDNKSLWPEMLRVIREVRPRWVLLENVIGHLRLGVDQTLSDLEDMGYTCWAFDIPAVAVDAPHRRSRVWIAAHSGRVRNRLQASPLLARRELSEFRSRWPAEPRVCRVDDGVPNRVDRIKMLGNSIVPEIAVLFGLWMLSQGATK